jgi:PBP1b-binding outer membrane lipoprotein LpoB
MKTRTRLALILGSVLLLAACATVDVTKTAKEVFAPTDPNKVDILMTKPDRGYTEVAAVSTTNWEPGETAKMHNALRAKCAPLGADAVLIINSGINPNGKLWATGVALHYQAAEAK